MATIVERAEQLRKDLGIKLGEAEEGSIDQPIIETELDDLATAIALFKTEDMDENERVSALKATVYTTTSEEIYDLIHEFLDGK